MFNYVIKKRIQSNKKSQTVLFVTIIFILIVLTCVVFVHHVQLDVNGIESVLVIFS